MGKKRKEQGRAPVLVRRRKVANSGNTTSGGVLARSKENSEEPARVAEEREEYSSVVREVWSE